MRKLLSIVQVILLLILIVSAGVIFLRHTQEQEELEIYADCQLIYRQDNPVSDDDVDEPPAQHDTGIDFAALNAVNEDVVGWITIPDTSIDYPIVQGENNSFYLNHAYNNKRNSLGSIFVDYRNEPDFSDFNTVIYGHYLSKDKSAMFSPLNDFLDESFWKEHKEFMIYTEDGKLHVYRIFSVYLTGATSMAFNTDMNDTEFPVFLSTASEKSSYQTDIYPNSDARIVTLACCYEKDFSQRVVVHGMKLS